MSETEEEIKSAAKKTGNLLGKGLKKGAKAVQDFGEGVKEEIKGKEEEKE